MDKNVKKSIQTGLEIAVIGMAGRFPGARNTREFWNNLKNGIESLTFYTDEELNEAGVEPELSTNPDYVKAGGGVLDNADCFDVFFFGYTPGEAEVMDPQVRVFHECVWEALEDAGYTPGSYKGSIGIYAGAASNLKWEISVILSGKNKVLGEFNSGNLSNKDFMCVWISYKLNLKGPAVEIHTACSTSLTAIHMACRALLTKECDIALAGGVSINLSEKRGYLYQEGMIFSSDGHCREFDAKASGAVGGSGAGVVVLKKLKEALKDGDNIYAVVKGSAINNDGVRKAGFTAPSIEGQADVIKTARFLSAVEPESISYIETHGTGTIIGDPIEMEALTLAFGTKEKNYCSIGSLKTNIGHLDAAAGVASFIKVVLALKYKLIPPSLNFQTPNPKIDFENSPFYVNTRLTEWKNDKYPLRAGVSSFGIGGGNAHVVLEEAPEVEESTVGKNYRILTFSAKTAAALEKMTSNLSEYLKDDPALNLSDAAYTLNVGREIFEHKMTAVCTGLNDAIETLSSPGSSNALIFNTKRENRPVVFMFPGQGSQYVNMGMELYRTEPLFRSEVDNCFKILNSTMNINLKDILYPGIQAKEPEIAKRIEQTEFAQPIIFIFEYALAKLLMKWIGKPYAMIGHSIGEYTAACLSGVFSLEDALNVTALRGRSMQGIPGGAMLSVSLPEEEVKSMMSKELSLAAANSSSLSVVSGPYEAIEKFETRLKGIECQGRRLHTSHAFHSEMMTPVLPGFEKIVKHVSLNKPGIPFISNVTGRWITPEMATNPGYWAAHLRSPVNFRDGLGELLKDKDALFVEVGPGNVLSAFLRQHKDKKQDHFVVNLVKRPGEDIPDDNYLSINMARLWLYGANINWAEYYSNEKRRRISLPTYPFDSKKFSLKINSLRFDSMIAADSSSIVSTGEFSQESEPAGEESNAISQPRPVLMRPYRAPRNELEIKMAKIWQDFFGYQTIGIDDDFFELGGDSLKAVVLISTIHREFNVKAPLSEIFGAPTVEKLSGYIQEASVEAYSAVELAEEKEYYKLSSAQKRLYIIHQMDHNSAAYNTPLAAYLDGELDKNRLEETFKNLITRHESLRTSFEIIEEEPVQIIHDDVKFEIEYHDSTGSAVFDNFIRPFELSKAPLLRAQSIKLDEKKQILVMDMHHIITDGTSMGILLKEIMAFYKGDNVPPLKLNYKDYAEWQTGEKNNKALINQEKFWIRQFEGEIPVLNLPMDYSRPQAQSFEGDRVNFELDTGETWFLNKLALEQGVTLFMVLLAIYNILLAKLSCDSDIIVGTPIAGRKYEELQNIIGMFVGTLALRNDIPDEEEFATFLSGLREKTIKAFENQDYQYEDLVEKVVSNRDTGRNPLFDIMFVLQNMEFPKIEIPGLKLKPYEYENKTSKFDLTLIAIEPADKLEFTFEYSIKLFKRETIERLIVYFKNIVTGVLEDRRRRIKNFEIINEDEKNRILYDFNETGMEYPKDKRVHELFEEQALRTPDHIAVVGEAPRGCPICLTYHELNKKSNSLAHELYEKGIGSGDIVGIEGARTIETVIGIVGILKAGAAYLPIDPDYPQERIDYMLKDSGAKIFLNPCPAQPLNLSTSQLLISVTSVSSVAYIIYTSGTTGRPKGVMVEHRNVVRLVKNTNYVSFEGTDRILQTGALEFDASTFEIWGTLLNRLTLYIVEKEEILDPVRLKKAIRNYGISIMWMTSPLFNRMSQSDIEIFMGLRNLLVGGDILSPGNISRLMRRYPELSIINGYGPTENTTFSTTYLIDKEYKENIPIGKPIANSTAYIVDRNNYLQPVGIPGELYLGGDGVASGYLNNPELTSEKFIQTNPGQACLSPTLTLNSNTFYRTGDLAKWLDDGNIEFLGRIDTQVKIRGFRVELGEIENRLLKHGGIKDLFVVSKEDEGGDKFLVAYFVSTEELNELELVEYLLEELPDYMIPANFVRLDKMPLTPNGKIDKRVLPEPEIKAQERYEAPRNDVEEKLVEIWAGVLALKKEQIGVNANFFQLGGHSLKATLLVSKIHKEFQVNVPLAEIFKTSTIRGLSNYIGVSSQYRYESIEPVEEKEYYALSSSQKRMYILQQADESDMTYNMTLVVTLGGELDTERFERTLRQLIERHESIRTSFQLIGLEPAQRIHEDVEFKIDYFELSKVFDPTIKDFIRPFDLSQAPLLRVGLIRIEEGKHILMVDMSHIISDGASMKVFIEDFMAIYEGKELPSLKIQYKDFSVWQNDKQGTESIKKQEYYWLNQFRDEAPTMELPYDYPLLSREQKGKNSSGDRFGFQIDSEDVNIIDQFIQEENVTLFMFLLAVYVILLHKLTWNEDIVVGTPVMGREHNELQPLIGVFINTLAIRSYPSDEKTFRDFLNEIKQVTLHSLENQGYPFEELVERLQKPLFDTMFVLQNMGIPTVEIPGLTLKNYGYKHPFSRFDMTFIVEEDNKTLKFLIEYRTGLFTEKTIELFSNYYKEIVSIVTVNRYTRLKDIDIAHCFTDTKDTIYNEASGNFGF